MERALRAVLSLGYHIDSPDGDGNAALQVAAEHCSEKVVSLLINIVHWDIIEVPSKLLDHGVDVNAEGPEGKTALIAAISGQGKHKSKMALELLGRGAQVDKEYGYCGGNALDTAVRRGHRETYEILLEHAANVNAPSGQHKSTALETACRACNVEVAKLLLNNGAECSKEIILVPHSDVKWSWSRKGKGEIDSLLQLLHERGITVDVEWEEEIVPPFEFEDYLSEYSDFA
jgi:ankyrin repeat protein